MAESVEPVHQQEPSNSPMPYYDGEKGWVAPDYKASSPRLPRKHREGDSGWVFADTSLPPTSFQTGPSGWVSEPQWDDSQNGARPSADDIKSKTHQTGKRGWVSFDYEKVRTGDSPFNTNPNLPVPSNRTSAIPSFVPPISIVNGEKTIVVEIELPGVKQEDVSLEIVSQSAQKVSFAPDSNEQAIIPRNVPHETPQCFLLVRGYKYPHWQQQKVVDEREYGFFERCVFLGHHLNKDSPLMAKYVNGILTIFVSKPKALPSAQ